MKWQIGLFLLVILPGCGSTRSTAQFGPDKVAKMYPISVEQADKILSTAMMAEFPDGALTRVELPFKGYQATIRFLLDSHTISAIMIPTKSRESSGRILDGFIFEVKDSGTMLISGSSRASSAFKRISSAAKAVSNPVPILQ